jgi:hypothetical protein
LQLHASSLKELGLIKLDIPNKNNLTSIFRVMIFILDFRLLIIPHTPTKAQLKLHFIFPFIFGNVNKYLTFKNIFIKLLKLSFIEL